MKTFCIVDIGFTDQASLNTGYKC